MGRRRRNNTTLNATKNKRTSIWKNRIKATLDARKKRRSNIRRRRRRKATSNVRMNRRTSNCRRKKQTTEEEERVRRLHPAAAIPVAAGLAPLTLCALPQPPTQSTHRDARSSNRTERHANRMKAIGPNMRNAVQHTAIKATHRWQHRDPAPETSNHRWARFRFSEQAYRRGRQKRQRELDPPSSSLDPPATGCRLAGDACPTLLAARHTPSCVGEREETRREEKERVRERARPSRKQGGCHTSASSTNRFGVTSRPMALPDGERR